MIGFIWLRSFSPGWIIDDFVPREYELAAFRMLGFPKIAYGLPENLICKSDEKHIDCPQTCTDPGDTKNCIIEQQAFLNNSLETKTLGVSVIIAPFLLFFGLYGLYVLILILGVIFLILVYLYSNTIIGDFKYSLLVALIFCLNPFILGHIYFSSHLIAFLFFLAALNSYQEEKRSLFLPTILYALTLSFRTEYILIIPLIFGTALKRKINKGNFILIVVISLIILSPQLYWNHYLSGNPLKHPSQIINPDAFAKVIGSPYCEHEIMGYRFNFSGNLNYPFQDKIYRTPDNPYPSFLFILFILISSFGLLLLSAAIVGIVILYIKYTKSRLMMIISLVWAIFLSVMQSIDNIMGFIFYIPLIIVICLGIVVSIKEICSKKVIAAILLTLIIVSSLIDYVSKINFEADPLEIARFKKAKNISETQDDDLQIVAMLKQEYTGKNLFPDYRQKISFKRSHNLKGYYLKQEMSLAKNI